LKRKTLSAKSWRSGSATVIRATTCGRFEKSEPTIVEGQDLDVLTFR
jgi:hypothetical protein